MRKESYEQLTQRLIELEKKYDRAIKNIREERKREHNLVKEVRKLLENATVLLPERSYLAVFEDDAGYIKEIKNLHKIITARDIPNVSGGYHKLVSNEIVIDEERKRLIEEMID